MKSKRREFSAQFKLETVLEGVRDEFMDKAANIFADKRRQGTDESAERIAELERLVGRLTMELEIAKKASGLLGSRWKANGR